jgi:hypothetical protein
MVVIIYYNCHRDYNYHRAIQNNYYYYNSIRNNSSFYNSYPIVVTIIVTIVVVITVTIVITIIVTVVVTVVMQQIKPELPLVDLWPLNMRGVRSLGCQYELHAADCW